MRGAQHVAATLIERRRPCRAERAPLQTVATLALLGASLAVALSLAIHSTLVHLRLF